MILFMLVDYIKKAKEITPMFTVAVICNNPPKAHGDKAFWNRLRIIPFESTFCDDAPITRRRTITSERNFPKINILPIEFQAW